MKIVPLGAHFGAEIKGIDLSSPIGANLAAQLRQRIKHYWPQRRAMYRLAAAGETVITADRSGKEKS